MTMSQLLCTPAISKSGRTDQLDILDYLQEIYRAGHLAFSEGVQKVDCPYYYGTLEYEAWKAGWDDAGINETFDQEAMRA